MGYHQKRKLSERSDFRIQEKWNTYFCFHRPQFGTNQKSKFSWIFEHFPQKENLNILELGCGTGLFWLANRNNIPTTWSIILSDYSEGMIETTRNTLSKINFEFQYEVVNAEDIKYSDKKFDIIIANNMLYHIENRQKAISHMALPQNRRQ